MKNFLRLFYDLEFYNELKQKNAHPIRQIFILIIISVLVYSIFYGYNFFKVLDNTKNYILNEAESFTIDEGKLFVNQDKAITYEDSNLKFIIDTRKNIETISNDENKFLVYVDSNSVVLKKNDIEIKANIFSRNLKDIDNKYVAGIFDKIKENSYLIAIPILIMQLLSKWFYVLIIGLMGYIILKIMKVDVDFKYIFTISAYILTIPTILAISNIIILNFIIPAFSKFSFFIVIIYFILIGKKLKKDDDNKNSNSNVIKIKNKNKKI